MGHRVTRSFNGIKKPGESATQDGKFKTTAFTTFFKNLMIYDGNSASQGTLYNTAVLSPKEDFWMQNFHFLHRSYLNIFSHATQRREYSSTAILQ